jgi:hypothetical protein
MFTVAAILLGLAALGGATLLFLRFRGGGNPPLLFAAAHGTFAASGLGTLTIAVASHGWRGIPLVAFGTLVLAALLGFFLVAQHLKGRLIPLTLALFHGMVAALGYVILLVNLLA